MTEDDREKERRLASMHDKLELIASELQAFDALYRAGNWRKCMSSLYYAYHNGVCLLLASHGIEPKSHDGAHQLFSAHFVRPGTFDRAFPRDLNDLMAQRQAADYKGFVDFDLEKVLEAHQKVAAFLPQALEYMRVNHPELDCGSVTDIWNDFVNVVAQPDEDGGCRPR